MVRREQWKQGYTHHMNKLYDKETLRTFKNAALDLIDNAFDIVVSPSEAVAEHLKSMPVSYGARDFRTVRIGGSRGIGHTELINRLSYDVDSTVGQKYSTLIITPKAIMAREQYAPYREYEIEKHNPRMAEYSLEYARAVKRYSRFTDGKALAAAFLTSPQFNFGEYMDAQRDAMEYFTGVNWYNKKFDLMLIDLASLIGRETMDQIYGMFADKVELFVLME